MLDMNKVRTTIVKGLKEYLGCTVIRGNQSGEIPAFPYLSYNITVFRNKNSGTYGVYEDGTQKIPIKQTWSMTVNSDNYAESMNLVNKAYDWLEYYGKTYLNDNNIIIESLTNLTDRSNILTYEYVYTYGFDFVVWLLNETEDITEQTGIIETAEIKLEESN